MMTMTGMMRMVEIIGMYTELGSAEENYYGTLLNYSNQETYTCDIKIR